MSQRNCKEGLTLSEARSQGTVATDRESSGRQVEQAIARSVAPIFSQ